MSPTMQTNARIPAAAAKKANAMRLRILLLSLGLGPDFGGL